MGSVTRPLSLPPLIVPLGGSIMRCAFHAGRAAVLAAAVVALFLPHRAFAATRTWDGGGANANWQTPANWDGPDLLPVPGTDDLHFAGTAKTTTNNDFAAPAVFNSITFDAGAGAFVLGGNAITLGGNITNSSTNGQTVNLGLNLGVGAVPIFNSGAAGLSLTGGVTGAAATGASQEVLLQGNNGKIGGVLSSGVNTNAGIRFRVDNTATADTDSWSFTGNSVSTFGGQLFVTRGTMTFGVTGDANNAPNVTINRVSGGNSGEFMTVGNSATGTGTFNMNNGTLNDGQNNTGTTSIRLALENTAVATGNGGSANWNQTGGTVTCKASIWEQAQVCLAPIRTGRPPPLTLREDCSIRALPHSWLLPEGSVRSRSAAREFYEIRESDRTLPTRHWELP